MGRGAYFGSGRWCAAAILGFCGLGLGLFAAGAATLFGGFTAVSRKRFTSRADPREAPFYAIWDPCSKFPSKIWWRRDFYSLWLFSPDEPYSAACEPNERAKAGSSVCLLTGWR